MDQRIGSWAFILGVIIAVVAGLAAKALTDFSGYITLVLVILGLIVGFLNIADKEITSFLVAAIAIGVMGTAQLGAIPYVGEYLASMVINISAFVAPAALVVALKAIYNLASSPAA